MFALFIVLLLADCQSNSSFDAYYPTLVFLWWTTSDINYKGKRPNSSHSAHHSMRELQNIFALSGQPMENLAGLG
jgi:hypothetical protein